MPSNQQQRAARLNNINSETLSAAYQQPAASSAKWRISWHEMKKKEK